MKKIILCLVVVFSLLNCSIVYSGTYESQHFVIHSDLDSRYVKILQSNIESFYEKILYEYFPKGWETPLDIYYSETQSDTQKLIAGFGYDDKVHYGVYISALKAIFTHRKMDSGGLAGLGTVYHEIVHRFVDLNYYQPQTWFDEGLATFLGEQTRCVNDSLTLGYANPWREHILREMIENGQKIDVSYLASLSAKQFYEKRENYHPTRALFYWIYDSGYLQQYLKNVKKQGYSLDVLEKTVGGSCYWINSELLDFIKNNCYPAAYYQDGLKAKTLEDKKRFFQDSLQIKPDYHPAKLELARCFYMENNPEKCKATLDSILDDPYSKEFLGATKLLANIYYKQKKYSEALEYYEKAWDCSSYDEYRYWNAYKIACCYHFLGNSTKAKYWYKVFIDENWEPDRLSKQVDYAESYQVVPTK